MSDSVPFFSIVIPVYNSEKYLNECLRSVISQTCDDYELILVDDASKDSSGSICDEWAAKYPGKIIALHQDNTGVYIAKRNGIKASSGKYIYVIDNDDLITSDRALETIKNEILEHNADLVIFNATDDIKTGHLLCTIPFEDRQLFCNEQLSVLYDEFLGTKNLHHIWMMVFKRELFDWDYNYSESFRMLRDGPSLILPIVSYASRVLYLKDTFYYWRVQNQNSASKHYDVIGFYRSIRHLHKRVIEYAKEWKYKSSNTDSLVKSSYVVDICIAAVKVRSIDPNAGMSRNEFLKMLSDDDMFRTDYTTDHLEPYRRIIANALFYKRYWVINMVSSLVGIIKGR
ncbi:MAG: glycosyltransferase family 2 protein [Firmicutes bacterium]|nr:glycosyltransferase family 2 protein [Bacillota bacterium]